MNRLAACVIPGGLQGDEINSQLFQEAQRLISGNARRIRFQTSVSEGVVKTTCWTGVLWTATFDLFQAVVEIEHLVLEIQFLARQVAPGGFFGLPLPLYSEIERVPELRNQEVFLSC